MKKVKNEPGWVTFLGLTRAERLMRFRNGYGRGLTGTTLDHPVDVGAAEKEAEEALAEWEEAFAEWSDAQVRALPHLAQRSLKSPYWWVRKGAPVLPWQGAAAPDAECGAQRGRAGSPEGAARPPRAESAAGNGADAGGVVPMVHQHVRAFLRERGFA